MQIEKLKRFESTTCPGVAFTVRRLGKIQRSARDFGIIAGRARISELYREYTALEKDESESATARKILIDTEVSGIMDRDVKPSSILAGLVSIEGLMGDAPITTATEFLDSLTPETDALLEEIYAACEGGAGLTGEEVKNSKSPITSTGPVVSENSSGSADTAA